MIFLCDVHISFKLVKTIENMGFTCVHVNSILDKWHTKDEDIMSYVDKNNMIFSVGLRWNTSQRQLLF